MSRKEDRVKIYKDTQRISRNTSGSFKQSTRYTDGDVPTLEDIIEMAIDDEDYQPYDEPAVIRVVDDDTLNVAVDMLDSGFEPLVLNMASDWKAGGGVVKGSRAQEEELFRRTNYCACVNAKFYPLESPGDFVVTEGVQVLKDDEYRAIYQKQDLFLDFIAMPAVRKPGLHGGVDYLYEEDREAMELKIDLIFRYAVLEEKDSLVLGALGCGAFRNPSDKVRDMFRAALKRYECYFKEIVFAVLSGSENTNYSIFESLCS